MSLISDDLKKAVKLFNRWQFSEASEAFEKLAPLYHGTDQSLMEAIQLLAEGFNRIWHKGGEPNALVRYLEKASDALEPLGTNSLGVATDELRREVDACVEEGVRWRRGDVEIYNRDLIPRLELRDPAA